MFNLAVKKNFEKNLPLKVYGNLKFVCTEEQRTSRVVTRVTQSDIAPSPIAVVKFMMT